jgi:hypothetical protein
MALPPAQYPGRKCSPVPSRASLHEAETRKWVIWRDNPDRMVEWEQDGFALNRTLSHEAEFKSYVEELNDPRFERSYLYCAT